MEDSVPEFYRRSGQTYADIIAATKEARERPALESTTGYGPTDDCKTRRCRKHSEKAHTASSTPPGAVDRTQYPVPEVINEQDPPSITPGPGSESAPRDRDSHSPHQKLGTTIVEENDTTQESDVLTHGCEPGSQVKSVDPMNQRRSHSPRFDQRIYDGEFKKYPCGSFVSEDPLSDNQRSEYKATRHDRNVQEDAVVQILITSEIENTKPLIVHRKISQSLREVRLAWCKRQGFTEAMQSSVFLTWKGRRLFDVTTCKSLEIKNADGFAGFQDVHPLFDEGATRVHVEAVTEDLLASKRQQQQLSRASTAESQLSRESPHIENEQEDAMVKIILKCPGLPDFISKISQRTQVSHIITAFKKAQKISTEQHVYLLFDGDRLDPDSCVVDYEIADLDLVDVLVK